MDETTTAAETGLMSGACSLPTAQRPLRLAELDEFLTTAVHSGERLDRRRLRLDLAPEVAVATRAADLVVRETECCSFFTFSLIATDGKVSLEVAVPEAHVEVLDTLAERVAGGA